WIDQLQLFFGEILPALVFGHLKPTLESQALLGAGIAVIIALVGALVVLWGWYKVLRSGLSAEEKASALLFFCSVMTMIALLLPSWRLFGSASFRYLVPYLPCLLLVISLPTYLILGKIPGL